MRYLILSTSLSPRSRSRVLCEVLLGALESLGVEVELVDLRDYPLPFCDAAGCYEDESVAALRGRIDRADGIVLATPIYNYTLGGTAKNLIELTGRYWREKVVAFLCAAGGPHSYMSIMTTASSLMLDFRSVVVPRFVYATPSAFDDERRLVDPEVTERVEQLGDELVRMTEALRTITEP